MGGMTVYIYGLRHPIARQIHYVGKSSNPARRLMDHKNSGGTAVSRWIRELGCLPDIVIYEAVTSMDQKYQAFAEKQNIQRLDSEGEPLVNIHHVPRNHKHTKT